MPVLLNPSLLAPVVGGSPYAAAVLADSPLAYYRLDEPSGTTMVDSSGNARNGTYTSVALGATGLTTDGDTAVTFNGSSSKGLIAHGAWMNMTFITIEALIKDTSGGVEKFIAARDDAGANRQFQFYVSNIKLLSVNLWNQAGTLKALQVASALSGSTTYHVAMTWDGTTLILYVNGSAAASVAFAGTSVKSVTAPIDLANLIGIEFWQGVIDEFAIYGTALSAGRIAAHYAAR